MRKLIFWLTLLAGAMGQAVAPPVAIPTAATPDYSKVYTGTDVVQAGTPPFTSASPCNTVVTLPAPYYSRMARTTCQERIGGYVPLGGGMPVTMSNYTDTLIGVVRKGGATEIRGFNEATLQAWLPTTPVVCLSAAFQFSTVNPAQAYCLQEAGVKTPIGVANGTTVYLLTFGTLSTSQCGAVSQCYDPSIVTWSVFKDFAQCQQAPQTKVGWHSDLRVVPGDTLLGISFSWVGGQDTGHLIFFYNSLSQQCTTLDTQGDGITPKYYTADGQAHPVINLLTGKPMQASAVIHGMDTTAVWMTTGGPCTGADCGTTDAPRIFRLSDMAGYGMGTFPITGGHHSSSLSYFFNDSNPMMWKRSPYTPATRIHVATRSTPGTGIDGDGHFLGDITTDSNPMLGSTGNMATTTWTGPYRNEVIGITIDGSQTIYRFAPTWSAGPGKDDFYAANGITGFNRARTVGWVNSSMNCTLGVTGTICNSDLFAIDLTGKH